MARLAVLGLCAGLAACDPASWTLVGVALDTTIEGYNLATKVSSDAALAIEVACRQLAVKEQQDKDSGNTATVDSVEQWSGASAFCDPSNPPPDGYPIAGAVWLGTVIAKL